MSAPSSFAPDAVAERFWARVDADADCWEWTGAILQSGYGVFRAVADGKRMAHRVAWELLVGPIPEGHHIDHLCLNRRCVNPAHLDPVTPAENVRRADAGRAQKHRARCPKSHPLTEDNIIRNRRGWRSCRTCHYDRVNARKREQRRLARMARA